VIVSVATTIVSNNFKSERCAYASLYLLKNVIAMFIIEPIRAQITAIIGAAIIVFHVTS
jgi:hypothetical protein